MSSAVDGQQEERFEAIAPAMAGGQGGKSPLAFFTNLKLSKKIGVGMGSILAFLIVVALVEGAGLESAREDFTEYRTTARQTNQIGRIQANLLEARLGVKDFILKGSGWYADGYSSGGGSSSESSKESSGGGDSSSSSKESASDSSSSSSSSESASSSK